MPPRSVPRTYRSAGGGGRALIARDACVLDALSSVAADQDRRGEVSVTSQEEGVPMASGRKSWPGVVGPSQRRAVQLPVGRRRLRWLPLKPKLAARRWERRCRSSHRFLAVQWVPEVVTAASQAEVTEVPAAKSHSMVQEEAGGAGVLHRALALEAGAPVRVLA
ncbi:hypothetical protein SALBM217S_10187 [Streptomyces griseoloalbus]